MAESNWLKTAWDAIRISIGAFVVPFMFLFSPALLLVGSTAEIIRCSVTCFVGMVALAGGGMGYLVRTLKMWERVVNVLYNKILIRAEQEHTGIIIRGFLNGFSTRKPNAQVTATMTR